jgi:putative Mg2+ transporter-C (MgtC) family protein
MSLSFDDILQGGWTPQEILANVGVFLSIMIALFSGLMVGYERTFRGRAAGMRTYALVCMASCALVAICADPAGWFSGHDAEYLKFIDPGRIIQGITTGIGFLGVGVIMRDGMKISGLTTAASIWSVAVIGVMSGMGFYGASILLALVSASIMMWGSELENMLPSRHAISVALRFNKNVDLTEAEVSRLLQTQGYEVAKASFSIEQHDDQSQWRFVAVSLGRRKGATLVQLSETLRHVHGIGGLNVAHARN